MKNEQLNKILKDILSEFGFEPNAFAMGMLDGESHRRAKIQMLGRITNHIKSIADYDYQMFCIIRDDIEMAYDEMIRKKEVEDNDRS
tara:strand:+ start:1670 stop:1930 length:261 start_codon:yes stop_codon:yes gene_type:complete